MVASKSRSENGATPTITLSAYVRMPIAGERTMAIDRLTALAADGAVQEVEITRVGREVILSEAGEATSSEGPGAAFERFVDWQDDGVESALTVSRSSTRTGRSLRTVEAPVVTLAVYADEELVSVFPCTDGDQSWSVDDALGAFEGNGAVPVEVPTEVVAT